MHLDQVLASGGAQGLPYLSAATAVVVQPGASVRQEPPL